VPGISPFFGTIGSGGTASSSKFSSLPFSPIRVLSINSKSRPEPISFWISYAIVEYNSEPTEFNLAISTISTSS
jgi:hypothetical protein